MPIWLGLTLEVDRRHAESSLHDRIRGADEIHEIAVSVKQLQMRYALRRPSTSSRIAVTMDGAWPLLSHQGPSLMLRPARITPTVSECACALSVLNDRYSIRADIDGVSLPSTPSP
jgi:hypothetical protein